MVSKRFTEEFKLEAIKQITERHYSVAKFVAKLISTLNVQEGSVQDSRTLGVAMAEEIVMSGIKKLNDGDKERLLSYPYFKCLS